MTGKRYLPLLFAMLPAAPGEGKQTQGRVVMHPGDFVLFRAGDRVVLSEPGRIGSRLIILGRDPEWVGRDRVRITGKDGSVRVCRIRDLTDPYKF